MIRCRYNGPFRKRLPRCMFETGIVFRCWSIRLRWKDFAPHSHEPHSLAAPMTVHRQTECLQLPMTSRGGFHPTRPARITLALYLELSWPDDVVRSEEIIATRVLDGGRDAVVEYRVTSHAENRTGQFFAAIHLHYGAGEWRIVLNHDITGFGDSL